MDQLTEEQINELLQLYEADPAPKVRRAGNFMWFVKGYLTK